MPITRTEAGLISVIMPCYNAAPFLDEAVKSVMNQSYPSVELIVIDDGSSDGSVAIQKRLREIYGDRITLLSQQHEGPYPARNLGLKHARGSFIAFLDADDWWSADCLEKLHAALERSTAVLAYCGWQNVGTVNRSSAPFIPPDYETENKAETLLRGGSPWPIHAALTRAQVIARMDGFHTDFDTSLDYELWLRIAATLPVVRLPEVLAFYRFHGGGQISSQPWRQAINGWRIKRRFLDEHPEIAGQLSQQKVAELVDGSLLRRGYQFYWQRDLVSAQHIFRLSLIKRGWKPKDLAYLIPALLPAPLYRRLVKSRD